MTSAEATATLRRAPRSTWKARSMSMDRSVTTRVTSLPVVTPATTPTPVSRLRFPPRVGPRTTSIPCCGSRSATSSTSTSAPAERNSTPAGGRVGGQVNGSRVKSLNLNGNSSISNGSRRNSGTLLTNSRQTSKTGNIPTLHKPSTHSRSAAPSPTPSQQPRAPANGSHNTTPTSPTSAYILPPSFGLRTPATNGVTSNLPTPNKSYTVNIINNCNAAPVPPSTAGGTCGRSACCGREKALLSEVLGNPNVWIKSCLHKLSHHHALKTSAKFFIALCDVIFVFVFRSGSCDATWRLRRRRCRR